MRRGTVALATSFMLLTAAAGPVSGTATPARQNVGPVQAVAFLNTQRAANGLPSGIVENVAWSDACAKHANYLELNSGIDFSNPHDEDPSLPGYTPEGQQAARSSVLGGVYDESGLNPYEDAPIHLMQLLGPGLAETGYAPGCMWTWPGYTRPKPVETAVYSYPGPGTTIYASETAREWPYTPGERIGIPDGTETGPYLYVFAFGEDAFCVRLTGASLTGPSGDVNVGLVDNATDGVGRYLPTGGIVIPTSPLQPASQYHAVVDGTAAAGSCGDPQGAVVPVHWDWSFQTETAPITEPGPEVGSAPDPKVRLKSLRRKSRLRVDVDPDGPGNHSITVLRYGRDHWVKKRTIRTRGRGHVASLNMPSGWYIARLEVSGGQVYSRRVYLVR